jgi:hypothetical protein
VIVRLLTEGQYRVSDDMAGPLNELDDKALAALDSDDEEHLSEHLEAMWALVQSKGKAVPEEEIVASDVIIPPSDLTLEEARELFSGDGLIPDIPT